MSLLGGKFKCAQVNVMLLVVGLGYRVNLCTCKLPSSKLIPTSEPNIRQKIPFNQNYPETEGLQPIYDATTSGTQRNAGLL